VANVASQVIYFPRLRLATLSDYVWSDGYQIATDGERDVPERSFYLHILRNESAITAAHTTWRGIPRQVGKGVQCRADRVS
jgi:hypothetical protein